ncbi:hypothetical protein K3495_g5515 [Podosphaera aphanis]|nr:hypothetical protein K3495_g5515 [Podosphaera aphanis]
MAHGFDSGCAIKHTMDDIFKRQIPLVICIDSFSLYECLVKLGTTSEKRLMIDLQCIRQAYERREIAEIICISGETNPADSMTKEKCNNALSNMIKSNTINVMPNGWVERKEK